MWQDILDLEFQVENKNSNYQDFFINNRHIFVLFVLFYLQAEMNIKVEVYQAG